MIFLILIILLVNNFLFPFISFLLYGQEKPKPAQPPVGGGYGRFLSICGEKSLKKANRHGTDVSWFLRKWGSLPLAGLPIAIREDHVVQITRDELVQHRTYHAPFLFVFYICIICFRVLFCKLQFRYISQFSSVCF